MAVYRWSQVVKSGRFLNLPILIRDLVHLFEVELETLEVEKHWLTETVRFTIRGEKAPVWAFRDYLPQVLARMNGSHESPMTANVKSRSVAAPLERVTMPTVNTVSDTMV